MVPQSEEEALLLVSPINRNELSLIETALMILDNIITSDGCDIAEEDIRIIQMLRKQGGHEALLILIKRFYNMMQQGGCFDGHQ